MLSTRSLLLGSLLTACAGVVSAGTIGSTAPACVAGSLQSYVGLSAGCSVSGLTTPSGEAYSLTYSSFYFASSLDPAVPNSPDTLIADATNIFVDPPGAADLSVNFSSSNFQVGAGDTIYYVLGYTIDPPPDILPGFDLEMDAYSPSYPGSATIDAAVCAGGNLRLISLFVQPTSCSQVRGASNFQFNPYNLHVEHSVTPSVISLFDDVTFAKSTNYIQVWMLIELSGGPAEGIIGENGETIFGSSQINGVRTFEVTPEVAEVPEPATWATLGAALGVLGFARRRRS